MFALRSNKIPAHRFGVDPDELAFSCNTSRGHVPLAIAAARYFIEISRVALPVGNNQTAETHKIGTVLPIADLTVVAKRHELLSIVDGTHLPGTMAYLGMDCMPGAVHKWQCGPGSTGLRVAAGKPPCAAVVLSVVSTFPHLRECR